MGKMIVEMVSGERKKLTDAIVNDIPFKDDSLLGDVASGVGEAFANLARYDQTASVEWSTGDDEVMVVFKSESQRINHATLSEMLMSVYNNITDSNGKGCELSVNAHNGLGIGLSLIATLTSQSYFEEDGSFVLKFRRGQRPQNRVPLVDTTGYEYCYS